MAMFENGSVVKSLAGRDKGSYMQVESVAQNGVFVCDGKERPLERPKLNNPKHLEQTGFSLDIKSALTNRALKRALRSIREECSGDT
jgi:ribosomal protein L14E/L6E/L27E